MAMKCSVAADAPRPGGRHARITRAGGRSPSTNSSLRDLPMMQRGGSSNGHRLYRPAAAVSSPPGLVCTCRRKKPPARLKSDHGKAQNADLGPKSGPFSAPEARTGGIFGARLSPSSDRPRAVNTTRLGSYIGDRLGIC
eukprot:scaffold994_cov226-Prasinococcus_capsulatus_cf.AAC.2